MYILCTFANIMNWCEEMGDIVFEPMASTSNKSFVPNPCTHGGMCWWSASRGSYPKVMVRSSQGYSKVKSAQNGWKYHSFYFFAKIMVTWDVYDGSKHSWTQTRTYAKTPQEVTGII